MLRASLTRLTVVVAVTGVALVGLEAVAGGVASAQGRGATPTQRVYGPFFEAPPVGGPTAQPGYSSLYSPHTTGDLGRKFQ